MHIVIAALVLDLLLGDRCIWKHPIILVGNLISYLEKMLYKLRNKKIAGLLLLLLSMTVVGLSVFALDRIFSFNGWLHAAVSVYFMYLIPSVKTLKDLTEDVYTSLNEEGVVEARKKLSYLVGRDTEELDEESVIKAAIETSAENTIDGFVAPLFYILVGNIFGMGLVFGYLYKTVNTLDSMVGYKNNRYMDFGYFSAKFDDVLNFIPARLGSLLMLVAGMILGYDWKNGIRIFRRDRGNHSSPNSAHSESVVAGLLNIQLGGENKYFGKIVKKPVIGDRNEEVKGRDIYRTNKILVATDVLAIIILTIGVVI
ncbi:adenosylcobinamide-phosphate synthase [Dethiosulfatibacter aminovorans DSM 17477]|uniref:Cobalamin biosynthesis protein CobD n=1 Tax=Dethiosulfatibacter aminovorans DSM 17477 TaxID=1121476 RepID=A0A1M6KKA7_9FIRM|nr:adenosylcobinamide-phosphate synthase CbiB [Dethiosulfatibacter aminovorans]SHJ59394.1 adenosylcobinamide-phosphate synthase [Dethiosulfatibacter aminovorans DSM 17477]